MAQSLSKVLVHITFSTKNRENMIDNNIEPDLFEYLGGICKGLACNPIQIGGHKNHIHVFCVLSKMISQIKLMEELKKQSSKWIKTKGDVYNNFFWQNGYGIFSVNPADENIVIDYIKNQEKHHEKLSFKEEYRAFLKKYKVEYDENYVWE